MGEAEEEPFASLGLLALTLCGSLGDDGTNC